MAQAPIFDSIGGLEVEKGRTYTSADLPTLSVGSITTIKVSEAPRLWRKDYNQDGTTVQKEGKDAYVRGSQRGVWILITRSTATYGTGVDTNVPVLYKEGEEIAVHTNNTYTFLSACRIEYGEV